MSRNYEEEWEATIPVLTRAIIREDISVDSILLQMEIKAYIRTGEASTQLLNLIENNAKVKEGYELMKEES